MKRNSILIILALSILSAVYFFERKQDSKKNDMTSQASFSFIKCTVAKYLLKDIDTTKQIAPLFSGLGNLDYPITIKTPRGQAFFNQGVKLTYAFNHAEAHRSFMEAARLDPSAAMAYWGQALTLGPNINDPFPDDERKKIINIAIDKALKYAKQASKKEQALINALSARYNEDLTADISKLNIAYMHAMSKVANKYPKDDNIQVLYAASVMNTVPWNYWDKEGNPSPYIADAKAALEAAMKIDSENAGAHHYYIHMVELPTPDLAVASADKLTTLMEAAGHIVHMPSHVYIRVGRYLDAVKANQAAILADEDYISQCFAQGLYPLAYYPHNIHFLWSASSLLGDSEVAIDAAKKTAEKVPVGEFLKLPFLQDFAATPLLAYTRFGKWNEILTIPAPNSDIKHLSLMRHYTRGIAFIRKGSIKNAEEELEAIAALKKDPELETLVAIPNNTSLSIANLAYEVVAGELAALKGNTKVAIEHLTKATILEDNLVYTEPSAWHIPTRQNLGDILLKAKKFEEAEKVYKEDLKVLRQNGWSLMGLYKSLIEQGKTEEATIIKKEFDKAWENADLEIGTSVL
ncbi:MAG: hypothetical protein COA50_05815 [Flavobacteriaceae bacterium]|nr:MAG: hypothetical protein COA50_05815 [Flavobacteriaceae bacterium]